MKVSNPEPSVYQHLHSKVKGQGRNPLAGEAVCQLQSNAPVENDPELNRESQLQNNNHYHSEAAQTCSRQGHAVAHYQV